MGVPPLPLLLPTHPFPWQGGRGGGGRGRRPYTPPLPTGIDVCVWEGETESKGSVLSDPAHFFVPTRDVHRGDVARTGELLRYSSSVPHIRKGGIT
eukprot:scaffold412_cov311-Pavlova_lutheri.AAC.27